VTERQRRHLLQLETNSCESSNNSHMYNSPTVLSWQRCSITEGDTNNGGGCEREEERPLGEASGLGKKGGGGRSLWEGVGERKICLEQCCWTDSANQR